MKKLLGLFTLLPLAFTACTVRPVEDATPPVEEDESEDRGITETGDDWFRVNVKGNHGNIIFLFTYDTTTKDLLTLVCEVHKEEIGANALLPARLANMVMWANNGTIDDENLNFTGATMTHNATVRAINYVLTELSK